MLEAEKEATKIISLAKQEAQQLLIKTKEDARLLRDRMLADAKQQAKKMVDTAKELGRQMGQPKLNYSKEVVSTFKALTDEEIRHIAKEVAQRVVDYGNR